MAAENPCRIFCLNADCFRHVFSFLLPHELVSSLRVSKEWRALVLDRLQGIRSYETSPSLPPGVIRATLRSLPNLMDLLVTYVPGTNYYQLPLCCKNLKSVTFKHCYGTADPELSSLVPIMLEELCMVRSNITGLFLLDFKSSQLKKLELSYCGALEPSYLCDNIGELCHLTKLTLDGLSKTVSVQLQEVLLRVPQLQEFSCCDLRYRQTGDSLTPLASMSDLRVLRLANNCLLDDKLLKDICTNCTKLRVLDIMWDRNPLDISYVWMLPELEVLGAHHVLLPPASMLGSLKLRVLVFKKISNVHLRRLMLFCPLLRVLRALTTPRPLLSFMKQFIDTVNISNRIYNLEVFLGGSLQPNTNPSSLIIEEDEVKEVMRTSEYLLVKFRLNKEYIHPDLSGYSNAY